MTFLFFGYRKGFPFAHKDGSIRVEHSILLLQKNSPSVSSCFIQSAPREMSASQE